MAEINMNRKPHPTLGKTAIPFSNKGKPSKTPLRTDTDAWRDNPETVEALAARTDARVNTTGYNVNDPEAAERATYDWIQSNKKELGRLSHAQADKAIRERYSFEQRVHAANVAQFSKATDERLKALDAEKKAAKEDSLTPPKLQAIIKETIDDAQKLAKDAMKQHLYIGERGTKGGQVGDSFETTGNLMVEDVHDQLDTNGNLYKKSIKNSGYNPYFELYGGKSAYKEEDPNWRAIRPATADERKYFQNKAYTEAFTDVMNMKLAAYKMRWNPKTNSPEPIQAPEKKGTPGAMNTLEGDPQHTMSQIEIMEDMINRGQNPKIVQDPVDGKTYVFTGRGNQKGWEELQLTPPGQASPQVAQDNINAMGARARTMESGIPTDVQVPPATLPAPVYAAPSAIPTGAAPPAWRRGALSPEVAQSEGFINYLAPEGGSFVPASSPANPTSLEDTMTPYAIPDETANALRSGIARGWNAVSDFFVPQQTATY